MELLLINYSLVCAAVNASVDAIETSCLIGFERVVTLGVIVSVVDVVDVPPVVVSLVVVPRVQLDGVN